MGYRLIKYIQGAEYNTKLFIVDDGANDLPPIVDKVDIMPGSEAWDIRNKDTWVLSTEYKWTPSTWRACGGGGGGGGGEISEIPVSPTNTSYVRYRNTSGYAIWKPIANAIEDIPESSPAGTYIREKDSSGKVTWIQKDMPEDVDPSTFPPGNYVRQVNNLGQVVWVEEAPTLPEYTTAQWLALTDKPAMADISDSVFDFYITNYIH